MAAIVANFQHRISRVLLRPLAALRAASWCTVKRSPGPRCPGERFVFIAEGGMQKAE